MKILLSVGLLLAMAGCDSSPPTMCDYCHVTRDSVKRFFCEKCKSSHATCNMENNLLHYEAQGRFQVPVYIAVCPPPGEPAPVIVEKVVEIPCVHDRTGFYFLGAVVALFVFAMGYGKGYTDHKNKPTGKVLE